MQNKMYLNRILYISYVKIMSFTIKANQTILDAEKNSCFCYISIFPFLPHIFWIISTKTFNLSSFPGILNDLLTSSEVSSVNSFKFSISFVFHLTLCGIIMQIISIHTSVLTVCISAKHFFQFVYNSTTKYQLHVVGWAVVAATVHKMTDHRTKVQLAANNHQQYTRYFHPIKTAVQRGWWMVGDCFITPTVNLSKRHFPMLWIRMDDGDVPYLRWPCL